MLPEIIEPKITVRSRPTTGRALQPIKRLERGPDRTAVATKKTKKTKKTPSAAPIEDAHELVVLRDNARRLLAAAVNLMTELGESEARAVLDALIVAVCDEDVAWRDAAHATVKKMSDMVESFGRGPSRGAPKKPETRMAATLVRYVTDSRAQGKVDDRALVIAVAHGFLDLRGVPIGARRETISTIEGQADRLAHADAKQFVRNVAGALGMPRPDNLTNADTQATSRAIRKKRQSRSRPHS